MLTQEKQEIRDRLSNLSEDERREIISSLKIDPTLTADCSKSERKQFSTSRMTWDKFDKLLIVVAGSMTLGTLCFGLRGGVVGAVLGALYGWYILHGDINQPHLPDKSQ